MGRFGKLFGKKETVPAPAETVPAPAPPAQLDPREDPNLVRVFDRFGRELFVPKEKWRTSVLPGTLKSNWNAPDQLYSVIAQALKDGFAADVLGAAEHLYRTDPSPARAACAYGVALLQTKRLDEAERVFRSHLAQHGEDGYVLSNLAKVHAARNETQAVDDTLWRAMEADPNQENGLGWYAQIWSERGGAEVRLQALRRVAALRTSWRAQVWLAWVALEAGDLEEALSLYQQSLSRAADEVP